MAEVLGDLVQRPALVQERRGAGPAVRGGELIREARMRAGPPSERVERMLEELGRTHARRGG